MAPLRTKNRDNLEFATNLPDKEERKRVRRLRVERAIAAQDTDGLDTSKNDEETTSCSLSQQQVGAGSIFKEEAASYIVRVRFGCCWCILL